jgi:hypothetical protein
MSCELPTTGIVLRKALAEAIEHSDVMYYIPHLGKKILKKRANSGMFIRMNN